MYKILKPFRDKRTGETYHIGAEHDFSKKRAKEIIENLGDGFITLTQETADGSEKNDVTNW